MKLSTIKATFLVAFLFSVGLLSYKGWKRSEASIDFKKMEDEKNSATREQTSEKFNSFLKNIGSSTDVVKPDILQSEDTLRLSMAVELLDTMKQYAYAGILSERMGDLLNSGWRYHRASRYYLMETYNHKQPENEFLFIKKAKGCLEKSVAIDPKNYAAKIDLAICIKNVNDLEPPQNTSDIMKPIMLLREVNAAEPNNVDAIYYLGKLAIESQQFEKAIERFKKLVSLQPQNKENYAELSNIYSMMGNKEEAKLWADKAQSIK